MRVCGPVRWPPEGNFFTGTVTYYSSHTGEHTVRYDDGDAEEVGLATFFPQHIYTLLLNAPHWRLVITARGV